MSQAAENFGNVEFPTFDASKATDQFRAFAGLEFPIQKITTMQVGYLNQHKNEPKGVIDSNSVLAVTFTIHPK